MNTQSNTPHSPFEHAVLTHQNRIYRTALSILGNVAEAEDIVQETFLRLYQYTGNFESVEHEKAWLIRVAVNLCKNKMRSSWWKNRTELLDIYPAKTEEEQELINEVMKLDYKYRTVIHLYYYEGYSTSEIARITGQKEGTVRSLMTRARKQLKLQLTTSTQIFF